MKDLARSAAVATCLLLLAACSSGVPTSTPSVAATTATLSPTVFVAPTGTPEPTPDLAHPVGIFAIGHSGLTGEGTAGTSEPNLANSWATGTSTQVNSVYLRLVAARPATEGHVANTAQGGAPASALEEQAHQALLSVPAPALAIISTLDNDIQCDGGNIAAVGQSIAKGLEVIHSASPNTKILMVGQLGRPSVSFVKELVAHDPSVKAYLMGSDPCSFYGVDEKLNEAGFAKLSAVVDAYETEQARVCASEPNCATDGGVRKVWVDKLEYFASDWNHLNVQGQAKEAALIWPVVKDLLGL
jgi:hypothetical protein